MANNLKANLLAAWLNDEVSGKRFDAHINGFDFEVEAGNVQVTTGIKGNACAFATDTANRLSRADDGSFDFISTQSFSVACWINQPADQNNSFIGKWDSSAAPDTDDSWLLRHRTTNNKVRFSISSDGTGTSEEFAEPSIVTPLNEWNLAAGGWDADNNEIWVQLNASPRVTVAHTGGAFVADVSLTTGWHEGNGGKSMANHDQDETYVWDRHITSDEFLIMYASGAGLFFSDFGGGAIAAGIDSDAYNYYYRARVG